MLLLLELHMLELRMWERRRLVLHTLWWLELHRLWWLAWSIEELPP